MRRTTLLLRILPLVLLGVSPTAGATGADGDRPAPDILIPGEEGAAPVQSVAASEHGAGRSARQAVFRCVGGSDDRSCGVSIFGDGAEPVAVGPPLFPGSFCPGDASMAWGPGGEIAVVAACRTVDGPGAWLQVTDGQGDPVAPPSPVATGGSIGTSAAPLVVSDGAGALWVFWLEGCPERCRLMARRYGWDAAPLGEALALTPPGRAALQAKLAGTTLAGGDVVVAWERTGDGGGLRTVSLLRLAGDGGVVARHDLRRDDPTSADRAPALDAVAEGCVVAWQRTWPRSNAGSTVLVQRLGDDLSAAGDPLDLQSLRPEAFGLGAPAITAGGRDLLVAWREAPDRGAAEDLLIGRLSGGGSWIGDPARVARSLSRDWPQIWLEPVAHERWALFWRQPPASADHPHPWLRRLFVPWQGASW